MFHNSATVSDTAFCRRAYTQQPHMWMDQFVVWFAFMTLQQCCMALRKSGTLASFPSHSWCGCLWFTGYKLLWKQCGAAAALLAAFVCNTGMHQKFRLAVTQNGL